MTDVILIHTGTPGYPVTMIEPLDYYRALPGAPRDATGCELPNSGPYVYFLWLGLELMYIGASFALWQRLPAHRQRPYVGQPLKEFDRSTWLGCASMDDAFFLESLLIDEYETKYNMRPGRKKRRTVELRGA